MTYFVYALVDPRTDLPFYVGCSINPEKRLATHRRDQYSPAHSRLSEIKSLGLECKLETLAAHDDKQRALRDELRWIDAYSVYLTNRARPGAAGDFNGSEGHWSSLEDLERLWAWDDEQAALPPDQRETFGDFWRRTHPTKRTA